jgi:hypothetical protein
MPTNTIKYAFIKPTVSADRALWGGYLNSNWDALDGLLGGTTALLNTKLTTPALTGGTALNLVLTTPTIATPTITNGTMSLPAITGGTALNLALTTPTLTTPTLTGGTSSGMSITTATLSGTGAGITLLNATNVATGTLAVARLPTGIPTANVDGLDTALAGKLPIGSNAVSATKLATTRAITLTGDVTGTLNFDGTAAVSMVTTITDDSHNHTTANIDGLDTALAGKAPTTHTHTTAQVTGLDTALAGKAASSHTHTTANVTGLDTALASKADDATVFTAGNGLSGGGSIGVARTFTLGTPTAITATSTDSVAATSHTHSLSAANIGTRMGQLAVGNVGTFAMLYYSVTGSDLPGTSRAGSTLAYSSAGTAIGTAPGGTWELHGYSSGSAQGRTSVWLRVI